MSPADVPSLVSRYLAHGQKIDLWCAEALVERQTTLKLFAAHCRRLRARKCRPFHLSDWIEDNPRWRSTATRKAKANQVNACFNWAVREERITRNPFAGVHYDEADPRPPMPDDVLEAVLVRANKSFELAVRFLRLSGCRLSDLCRMRWGDIDWVRGVVKLTTHKSKRKTHRIAELVLVRCAMRQLWEMAQAKYGTAPPPPEAGNDLIFTNTRGTAWNRGTLGQQLRRMKKRYRLHTPASLHGLRHQVGSRVIAAGGSLKLLSKGLIHAGSAVTERFYVHVDEDIEAIRKTMELGKPRGW